MCLKKVARTTKKFKIKNLATIVNGYPQTSKMQDFVRIINFTIKLETMEVPWMPDRKSNIFRSDNKEPRFDKKIAIKINFK